MNTNTTVIYDKCDNLLKARASKEKKGLEITLSRRVPSRKISNPWCDFFGISLHLRRIVCQRKINKSRYRSRLTVENLKYCGHLCLSNYEPCFNKLLQDIQCRASILQ